MRAGLGLGIAAGLVISPMTVAIASLPPQAVVTQFYQWLVQHQDQSRQQLRQQQHHFTPELYQQLTAAFRKQPQDGAWLDFDPFSYTQVSTLGMQVRTVTPSTTDPRSADVDIDVIAGLRGRRGTPVPIKVIMKKTGDRWQIDNLVYMSTWDNLRCILREINR
ncbi:DUF3828 domain-containing protein [Parathermosynechococcus lividus]